MPVRLSSALIAEFVGTFALCLIGILGIHHSGGNLIAVALAHGLILSVVVTAAMPSSGGHLNPVVTLGFLITGKIKVVAGIAYIVTQLIAGVAAAAAVAFVMGGDNAGLKVVLNGTPDVAPNVGLPAALLAEIIATFFLVWVIWGTAAEPRAKQVGGFAIGLTVAADILAIGPLTGAAMNPARAFGPALIGSFADGGSKIWASHWVYWVGPAIGACVAAALYYLAVWPRDREMGVDPGARDVPKTQRPS